MDWQHQVATFMREVKHLDLPSRPTIPSLMFKELCKSLMNEELDELCGAINRDDMVEVADGIADLLYVTLYTANAYGLIVEPIFAEVQRSNMTKRGGPTRSDGKQLKPADWSPPDIESIVQAQRGLA